MRLKSNLILPEMRGLIPICTCSLCSTILQDVITIKCGHHFCKLCLLKWIQNQESADLETVPCPKCTTGFNTTNDTYKCQVICDVLSVLEGICPNQPCAEIIGYDGFDLHQQVCLYSPISCKLCEVEIFRKNLKTHTDDCMRYITVHKAQLEVDNKSLKTENDHLKKETDLLKCKITSLEEANDKENKIARNDLLTEKSNVVNLENANTTLKQQKLEINKKHIELKNEIADMKTSMSLLKTDLVTKEDENTQLRSKYQIDINSISFTQKSNEKMLQETLKLQHLILNSNKTVLTNQLDQLTARNTDISTNAVTNVSMQIGLETLKWKIGWPTESWHTTSGRKESTNVTFYIKKSEPIMLNVASAYIRSVLNVFDDKRKL